MIGETTPIAPAGPPAARPPGLRWLVSVPLIVLSTALTAGLITVGGVLGLINHRAASVGARWWSRSLCWAAGVRIESVEGLENLPTEGGYILAPNHRSLFDIPIIQGYIPIQTRWMAKKSLFDIPLFGSAMVKAGYLPVDREESSKALALLKQAARRIKEGVAVVIFPEGTRNLTGHRLGPFKKGGLFLARLSGRPVIPVALVGSNKVLPAGSLKPRPERVRILIGKPLEPEKNLDLAADRLRQAMTDLLIRLDDDYVAIPPPAEREDGEDQ